MKISPKAFRAKAPELRPKDFKEFLNALAPENKTLAAIRAAARKNGKSRISRREIDREIQPHRRKHPL